MREIEPPSCSIPAPLPTEKIREAMRMFERSGSGGPKVVHVTFELMDRILDELDALRATVAGFSE